MFLMPCRWDECTLKIFPFFFCKYIKLLLCWLHCSLYNILRRVTQSNRYFLLVVLTWVVIVQMCMETHCRSRTNTTIWNLDNRIKTHWRAKFLEIGNTLIVIVNSCHKATFFRNELRFVILLHHMFPLF